MKKVLFYTIWDFTDEANNGICKKIRNEKKVLEEWGYSVDLTYIKGGQTIIEHNGRLNVLRNENRVWNKLFADRALSKYVKSNQYDVVFCRYGCSDYYFIQFLKNAKKNDSQIIVEIPTYPYDKEFNQDLISRVSFKIDKHYRQYLKRYTDRILTFSRDKSIFGIPTIQASNGVDFSKIKIAEYKSPVDSINLVAVAGLSKWHGYDRLIKGIGEYYSQGGNKRIVFHLVGDGEQMENYRQLITQYDINEYIHLYGFKSGQELEDIYDMADIAVSSLGIHRLGLDFVQTLKSKEYGAKGLPIITEIEVEEYPNNERCVLMVPANEDPIDVDQIISFYNKICSGEIMPLRKQIREKVREKGDIHNALKPLKNFMESEVI